MKEQFIEIRKRVWEIYYCPTKATFMVKIRDLKEWAKKTIHYGTGQDTIINLCDNANEFAKAYDYPSAYRTSNMLDRIMDHHDRYLYSNKYFHGHSISSEYSVRAWALLYNFHPYCPRSTVSLKYKSPAHKLNGFFYNDNWLHNLLISASMGGLRS